MRYKLFLVFCYLSVVSCYVEGNIEGMNSSFLDINNETMWQSTKEYYQDTYIGFSNNIEVALIYSVSVDADYGYCTIFKVGENIMPWAECNWEEGTSIQTYTILTNTENLLVVDFNYYDASCDLPFSIDYRYSYSVDGDFLYETIEQIGQETMFNEYSKSNYTFDDLCQ